MDIAELDCLQKRTSAIPSQWRYGEKKALLHFVSWLTTKRDCSKARSESEVPLKNDNERHLSFGFVAKYKQNICAYLANFRNARLLLSQKL